MLALFWYPNMPVLFKKPRLTKPSANQWHSRLAKKLCYFLTHHFPTVWTHARLISILKPGKDPALPSTYRPITLLDTIGKLFEKILLARILPEVSEH